MQTCTNRLLESESFKRPGTARRGGVQELPEAKTCQRLGDFEGQKVLDLEISHRPSGPESGASRMAKCPRSWEIPKVRNIPGTAKAKKCQRLGTFEDREILDFESSHMPSAQALIVILHQNVSNTYQIYFYVSDSLWGSPHPTKPVIDDPRSQHALARPVSRELSTPLRGCRYRKLNMPMRHLNTIVRRDTEDLNHPNTPTTNQHHHQRGVGTQHVLPTRYRKLNMPMRHLNTIVRRDTEDLIRQAGCRGLNTSFRRGGVSGAQHVLPTRYRKLNMPMRHLNTIVRRDTEDLIRQAGCRGLNTPVRRDTGGLTRTSDVPWVQHTLAGVSTWLNIPLPGC
ncbi:hypothetical protein J6590_004654 [Homalodisca vitripennis]|nr:hypothetical protein J6590_004654 [Homalodisca vitripennis]